MEKWDFTKGFPRINVSGHSIKLSNPFVSSPSESGRVIKHRTSYKITGTVNVSFDCDMKQYNLVNNFFYNIINGGIDRFEMDLLLDNKEVVAVVEFIDEDGMNWQSISQNRFNISKTLLLAKVPIKSSLDGYIDSIGGIEGITDYDISLKKSIKSLVDASGGL